MTDVTDEPSGSINVLNFLKRSNISFWAKTQNHGVITCDSTQTCLFLMDQYDHPHNKFTNWTPGHCSCFFHKSWESPHSCYNLNILEVITRTKLATTSGEDSLNLTVSFQAEWTSATSLRKTDVKQNMLWIASCKKTVKWHTVKQKRPKISCHQDLKWLQTVRS
jgi:hypothetical protein